jgi:hypothetical protein
LITTAAAKTRTIVVTIEIALPGGTLPPPARVWPGVDIRFAGLLVVGEDLPSIR